MSLQMWEGVSPRCCTLPACTIYREWPHGHFSLPLGRGLLGGGQSRVSRSGRVPGTGERTSLMHPMGPGVRLLQPCRRGPGNPEHASISVSHCPGPGNPLLTLQLPLWFILKSATGSVGAASSGGSGAQMSEVPLVPSRGPDFLQHN